MPSLKHLARHARRLSTPPSSVDPAEIAHFSRLSSQWWDEHGEFRLLHKMNPTRVAWITQVVLDARQRRCTPRLQPWAALRGMRVLDVGCGGGLLSESLARLGASVTGLDASASNISIAQLHKANDPTLLDRLHYTHSTVESLGEHSSYDAVCVLEVLEHVEQPAQFLKHCADLVKPGGHIFISTISRTFPAHLITITVAEDLLGLVARGTHTYSKYILPSEMVEFFQNLGWTTPDGLHAEQAEVRGIQYSPSHEEWQLAPRGAMLGDCCNYLFSTSKPQTVLSPPVNTSRA